MKLEPEVDKARLAERLARKYGLTVRSLTFIPKGFASSCYAVDCLDGSRYFLKLIPSTREPMAASDLEFYLPLTWNLYDRGIFCNLPYPLRNDEDEFRTVFGEFTLILFNYIDGETLEGEDLLSDFLRPLLARSIGTIHKSTPDITMEKPFTERFALVFEDDLLDALDVLRGITSRDRFALQVLRDLLLPREMELRAHLARACQLRDQARAVTAEMVLCHTDLWGGNLILDRAGDLHILDWENAMIAPPEHDLFAFVEHERFSTFLDEYEQTFRRVELRSETFGFYIFRRNLEDLADWVLRILSREQTEEQDRDDLDGVRNSLSQWSRMEATIRDVADKLRRRYA